MNHVFIIPAILMFIVASTIKAYQHGLIKELLAYIKLITAFFAGWFLKAQVGSLLPVPGLFSSIAGFYLVFLLVFLLFPLLARLITPRSEPGSISKIFAAFAGALEGLVLGLIIFIALTLIPGSDLADHQPPLLRSLTSKASQVIEPMLPAKAGKTIKAVKTMTRISKGGIDPKKVDRQELIEVFKPLSTIPEIKQIQNDPELRKLIAEKQIKKIIKHPAIQNLAKNPELQEKVLQIDWERLERALGKSSNNVMNRD
ncbi:MAG: CvpA family protein [Candidatus Rifleibacteriota bacterium]